MHNITITQHTFENNRHRSAYLAAGPEDGPLAICVHGWPERALSWRHQLPFLASLGFRAIAPDMRGYGDSSIYAQHDDYRLEESVRDLLDLLAHLSDHAEPSDKSFAGQALWLGHDWGAPVVWSLASHHPDKCIGVVNLCVPYATLERGLDVLISHVDRAVYPIDEFPAGQWEYMRFYEENFAKATAPMDANPTHFIQAIFRQGSAEGFGQPASTAMVRKMGGWFGELTEAPAVPIDENVISAEELQQYASGLTRNGFFGPNSWYMNHAANAEYGARNLETGQLDLPVLFLAGRFDYVCETVTSDLAEPMRALCSNLTEEIVDSGHWMAQEQPVAVNRALARWLINKLPTLLQQ